MNTLIFNCGSSSLKYRLIEMPSEKELAGGEAQRVGPPTSEPARIVHRAGGRQETVFVDMPDHAAALGQVLGILERSALAADCVGHRIVHGGALFGGQALLDAKAVKDLESLSELAPLHNVPALKLIKACARDFPSLPQVGVFDTAYHATISEYARTYALPKWLVNQLGFRKYGFHGTSHQFVAEQAAAMLGKPLSALNAVSCHLGSGGASLCAIVAGRSVDNTMGYSPTQGLVMSTRCGDLDPAVAMQLLSYAGGDARAVEKMLNTASGVLGLSGKSADIRDAMAAGGRGGDGQSGDGPGLTAEVYLWRIRKYLGAYLAVVGKADAVIFTDTIGETSPAVRQAACENMEAFGLEIDPQRNQAAKTLPADVSRPSGRVRILVIATNEELAIARQTYGLLSGLQHAAGKDGAK